MKQILVHSGKHPFEPFDYRVTPHRAMSIFGDNSGNILFADAVFKYLYTSADTRIDSDGYRFGSDDPDMAPDVVNERYDAVVIPAANWLAPHFRRRLPGFTAAIRQLKIPCVVVGLGVQSNSRTNFDCLHAFREEATAFLAAISNRCHSISVRGEYTNDCLQELGFKNAQITGCPSFCRNLDAFDVAKTPVSRSEFRMAVHGTLSLLRRFKGPLFERHPSVFFSQSDVLEAMKHKWRMPRHELRRWLSDGFSFQLINSGRVRCYGDVTPWLRALREFSLAIGSRIHGSISALLAGTPAVLIPHDSRTAELAEVHHIPALDPAHLPSDFDPYEVFERADYSRMLKCYPERRAGLARFFSANGLEHTLFEKNGETVYDRTVAEISFEHGPYTFDDPFFRWAGRLAPAFAGMKSLTRTFHASAA